MARSALTRLLKSIRSNLPFRNRAYALLRRMNVPERVYRHLPVDGWIRIATGSGRSFRMYSYGDVLENSLFWSAHGCGDGATSFRAWELLAAGADGLVLDVGANTGLYALLAQATRPDLTVIAFEPVRRIAAKLARNVAGNGFAIQVVEKAVSDRDGTATFHDSAAPDASTNAYSASLESAFAANDHSYPVETITLDGLALPGSRVALVKIDVELHEVSALRGMMAIVERDRPAILIEILTEEIAAAVSAMLHPFGYRFYSVEEAVGLHRAERLRPLGGRDFNNIACLPATAAAAGLDALESAPPPRPATA